MLVLAAAALIAGALILTLPRGADPVPEDRVQSVRQALRLILTTGPLRRVMYTTVVAAVPGGAIAIIAVGFGHDLQVNPGTAGLLTAGYGPTARASRPASAITPAGNKPPRSVAVHLRRLG